MTAQVRLLQGQTVLEDDRKLCEYSLPEGATISALFEPDADINIEVSMGYQLHQLTVSKTTSIMALKLQVCEVMRCDVAPEKLEIKLGDVTLEDPMPLHFYEIMDGSKLNVLKPYVNVTILNNKGTEIFWRLKRRDTIKEVKTKLATVKTASSASTRSLSISQYGGNNYNGQISGGYSPDSGISTEASRLYFVASGQISRELDDDETVEHYKIKDDDRLFLLSYRWTTNRNVFLTKAGRNIQGVELDDTCLGIKLKAQDQFGIPVTTLKLFRGKKDNVDVEQYLGDKDIDDTEKPFSQKIVSLLVLITEEELQTEGVRKKAQLEAAAAEAGFTVEAYEQEQERQRKNKLLLQQKQNQRPIIKVLSRTKGHIVRNWRKSICFDSNSLEWTITNFIRSKNQPKRLLTVNLLYSDFAVSMYVCRLSNKESLNTTEVLSMFYSQGSSSSIVKGS